MPVQLTTVEYWDVDGVPLNSYAYNISTLTGRTGTTGLRGDDMEHAYRPGRTFTPKVADSRTLTLMMWVQGSDPNTVGQVTGSMPAQFQTNLRMLLNLFYTPRRQFSLTKRWIDNDGLHVATAKGQVVNAIEPTFNRGHAVLPVEVYLTDPFFYDTTETSLSVAVGGTEASFNPGDDSTPNRIKVTFVGPLTNPTLKNTTPNPDISMTYTGTVASGQSLVVDVPTARAYLASATNTSLTTKLNYSGSIFPMEVFSGSNTFALTSSSGSGSATITYRPAYL